MPERSQPVNGLHPALVGAIFVAVAFLTILMISLYCTLFLKTRKKTRLEQRVARREWAVDRENIEEDLEMEEVPLDDLDDLKVPPKATTRK
ncbi:hypothetical protein V490_05565 [Pseudogymnoascus sp. VKM F-3557]|nr:hypothetical protein V490_05565 [Pseudogymnoascus sp. VKM F-3557]